MAGGQETWATALERLALLLGGPSEQFRLDAETWLRQSLEASCRRSSLHDLTRPERQVAFQLLRVVYDLAGGGELAFAADQRQIVARAFARHFGACPVGPPWRLSPVERDRPTFSEYMDDALPGESGRRTGA